MKNIYVYLKKIANYYRLGADTLCLFDIVFKNFIASKYGHIFVPMEAGQNFDREEKNAQGNLPNV